MKKKVINGIIKLKGSSKSCHMNNRKLTNEEKRKNLNTLLEKGKDLEDRGKFYVAEKTLFKACRIAENIYRQTASSKDKIKLIESYVKISTFYKNRGNYLDIVQKWYQKIVGVLSDACNQYSSLDDYRYLLEWIIKTIYLMNDNTDYKHQLLLATKMKGYAKLLYKKTKTHEDLKFIILAELFLGDANQKLNHPIKAYYYYQLVAKKLEKIYYQLLDETIMNDLFDVYYKLLNLTNHKLCKIFHRKWQNRIYILKEKKNAN